MKRQLFAFAISLIACTAASLAADIEVKPGAGTISAAAANAKPGDTLLLQAGEYTDNVRLGEGVTLKGAGPDKTVLTGPEYALVNCTGHSVTVIGIEFRPGEKTVRGVNASLPVRVERCRFKGVKEAVALMGAPLSDIVCCDFIDCGIGVRAIGKACPTVWGCKFSGGGMGVFGMDGAPYVRNNLFVGQKTGVRVISDEAAIIRNNIFWKCSESGVESSAKNPIFAPSIRNNIFDSCGAAVVASADQARDTSHAIVHAIPDPAFRGPNKEATLKDTATIVSADPELALTDSGELKWKQEIGKEKGIRLNNEPEGTKGNIGLDGLAQPGTGAEAKPPPSRFTGPIYIANSVAEEYMALQALGMPRSGNQSMGVENGVRLDKLETRKDGKPFTAKFDIERFFSEAGLKP
jgi:hypothetical protein